MHADRQTDHPPPSGRPSRSAPGLPKGPCSALLCAGGRAGLANGLETTSCHIVYSTMSCLKGWVHVVVVEISKNQRSQ